MGLSVGRFDYSMDIFLLERFNNVHPRCLGSYHLKC